MTNPEIGVWLSENGTVGTSDLSNLYRYCGNGPTNRVDPGGLASVEADDILSGWLDADNRPVGCMYKPDKLPETDPNCLGAALGVEPLPLPDARASDPDADLEEPIYLAIQTGRRLSAHVAAGAPGSGAT